MCVVTFDWKENDSKEKVKHYEKHGKIAWAVVEVTNACNLNCIWCYAASGENFDHSQQMSIEKLKKLISTLRKNGIRQITFSGGEPTVYPHIKEAIGFAKGNGLVVHMNTNGYVLNRRMAEELAAAGLTQVQINIDSLDPGKHDHIRGRRDSFRRAVRALKNANMAGMTTVSQTVVTKETEKDIFKIFRFAKSIGVGRSRVWDMTPSGSAIGNMSLIPTDYVKMLRKLSEFAYRNGANRIESGDPLFPNGFETKMEVSGGFCTAAKGAFMTIAYTGDVLPCVTQRAPLYNIFSIKDRQDLFGFHMSKIRGYAASINIPHACKPCKALERCSGGCMTRRKFSEGGDYNCSCASGKLN